MFHKMWCAAAMAAAIVPAHAQQATREDVQILQQRVDDLERRMQEAPSRQQSENAFNPAVSEAFKTGCTEGCTPTSCSCTADNEIALEVARPPFYWSSTTDASAPAEKAFPGNGWGVDFFSGFLGANVKDNSYFIRCVRGGS